MIIICLYVYIIVDDICERNNEYLLMIVLVLNIYIILVNVFV